MAEVWEWDPSLYSGSAGYYARGRAAYPPELAEAFVAELERDCGLPVTTVDERFSSRAATDTNLEMGVPKMKRRDKGRIDAMAAALILQDYLDDRPGPTGST